MGFEAPLQGDEQVVAHYAYPTLVAMTVHQHFAITVLPPSTATGQLGLAGRVWAWGCSHQGEAYLVSYPDEGGYLYSFGGCHLASEPDRTTYSDTVLVNGTVKYGYTFDSACPYPDYGCAAYSGSSGVQLSPLHATLSITSDSLHDGELWVWPGEEYPVRAVASPDRMGQFLTPILPTGTGWSFKPDSGAEVSDVCLWGGSRDCAVAFSKSGYLKLTALVNGEETQAPPLRIQPPELSVALSDTVVSVGDTILLTTTLRGADASILTGYYAGITASLIKGTESPTAPSSPENVKNPGVPPCLGTDPVPLHCYMVMSAPGRALVGVSARIGRTYFGDYKYVTVRSGQRAVSLEVGDKSIRPTSRFWKFNSKTKQYTLKLGADTSRTTLTVSVKDASGNPVPNSQVSVRLVAQESTAGHEHTGSKPAGSLQTLERAPITDGRIDTGPSGVAKVSFVASEVSGPVTIVGESANASPDSATVTGAVSGLIPLEPGAHYVFTGAQQGLHTDNHYGIPAALRAFQELADTVSSWTGEPLGINDISLRDGGLFDVGDDRWDIPHGYHRRGNHADIRIYYNDGSVFPPSLQVSIAKIWQVINRKHDKKNKSNIVPEGNHLHVQWYP